MNAGLSRRRPPLQPARQRGAIASVVALSLLALLGFVGFALDFSQLFVVRGELQQAVDACALAAATELDGSADAITRARSAGMAARNANRVGFQSASWNRASQMLEDEVRFRDAAYAATTLASAARYVECQHTHPGVRLWLLPALGASVASADSAFASTQDIGASAIASRASAQSGCPVPLALRAKAGGAAPNYGFQNGEWVTLLGKCNGSCESGKLGWMNLDGSRSVAETKAELSEPGRCGSRVGDQLGRPSAAQSLDEIWNARFGIYKNNDATHSGHPDFTGYAYTAVNWKNAPPQNAYAGAPAAGSHVTAANFKAKRAAFASYADLGNNIESGDAITGLSLKGGFKSLATAGPSGQHKSEGMNRRIILVPIVNSNSVVIDFACMLMLQPLSGPNADVDVEFIANAAALSSPCTAAGVAGGVAGPQVAVLVQ